MKTFVFVMALVIVGACVPPQTMPVVSLAPNAMVDSTGRQIRIRMAIPPDQASARLVQALVEQGIPVTSNQGGIVEARLPREMGLVAQYEIVVRAYVAPVEGGSSILLFGEEGSFHSASQPATWLKIGAFGQGRALATWLKLEAVGKALGAP